MKMAHLKSCDVLGCQRCPPISIPKISLIYHTPVPPSHPPKAGQNPRAAQTAPVGHQGGASPKVLNCGRASSLPPPMDNPTAHVRDRSPRGGTSALKVGWERTPVWAETFLDAKLKSRKPIMTKRGPKPTPARLRLVIGGHRPARHGPKEKVVPQVVAAPSGSLEKPSGLSPEALAAWDRFIVPAVWLDPFRAAAAVAFCELWAEFMRQPAAFQASRHAQLRAYMGDLGLTDERNRRPPEKPTDPADKYF